MSYLPCWGVIEPQVKWHLLSLLKFCKCENSKNHLMYKLSMFTTLRKCPVSNTAKHLISLSFLQYAYFHFLRKLLYIKKISKWHILIYMWFYQFNTDSILPFTSFYILYFLYLELNSKNPFKCAVIVTISFTPALFTKKESLILQVPVKASSC